MGTLLLQLPSKAPAISAPVTASIIGPIGREPELTRASAALTHTAGVILTGAPGVGKTHLARRITTRFTSTDPTVPVHLASAADSSMPRWSLGAEMGTVEEGLVVLEDAHLLDPADLDVLAHRCRTGPTRLIATAHTIPPALGHLVRDGILTHLTVPALEAGEVAELVRALLGGNVAADVTWYVWQTSAGNPRHAIDLVESATADGGLARRDGTWLFLGPPRPSSRILDLVAAELDRLSADERDLIDIVALGSPVPLATILATTNADALDAQVATRRLVVGTDGTDGRPVVSPRHPRFGDIAAMLVPPVRRRRLFDRVMGDARLPDGPPTHVMSAAKWALSAAAPIGASELFRAVRIAENLGRIDITEQLATATLAAFDAHGVERIETLLIRSLARRMAGRVTEALADARTAYTWAGALEADASTRARWSFEAAVATANLLQFSFGDTDGALALVDSERRRSDLADPEVAATLLSRARADHTMRLAYSTRFAEAEDARPTAVELPTLPPDLTVEYQVALGFVEAFRGQLIDARNEAARLAAAALALGDHARWGPVQAQSLLFVLLSWAGEIDEATAYLESVESEADMPGYVEPAARQMGHGVAAMAKGDWAAAIADLDSVIARFRVVDLSGWLPVCLSWAATARAADGQCVEAAALLAEARAAPPGASGLLRYDLWDHWWRVAFTIGSPDAASLARSLVDHGRAEDLALVELWGWHALAVVTGDGADPGFRDEALERLDHLEGRVQGVLPTRRAEHARALLAGDGPLAAAMVERLAESGFWAPHRAAGSTAALTDRQRQVAQLAAAGLSSAAIAERLFISKRTVDAHLNSIYDRLGVRNRNDLAAMLAAPSQRASGPR